MSPARQMNSKKRAARDAMTTRFVVGLQRDLTVFAIIRHRPQSMMKVVVRCACKVS